MKKTILFFAFFITISIGNAQKNYVNDVHHFSFEYNFMLFQLSEERIDEINNAYYNLRNGIVFETGFENFIGNVPPLILVNILKSQRPAGFNARAASLVYKKIDVSRTISVLNEVVPLIKSASLKEPIIDLENKIFIFSVKLESTIWDFDSKGRGLLVQFYGKDEVVQINFATTENRFESDYEKYFKQIIESFSFKSGYTFTD